MTGQFNGGEWENKLQWIMEKTINGNGPKNNKKMDKSFKRSAGYKPKHIKKSGQKSTMK
jgi:hypothetical protein